MRKVFFATFLVMIFANYADAQRPYIEFDNDTVSSRSVEEILASLPPLECNDSNDWVVAPRLFQGYMLQPFIGIAADNVAPRILGYHKPLSPMNSFDADWLSRGKALREWGQYVAYELMGQGTGAINYLAWSLPDPPQLLPVPVSSTTSVSKEFPVIAGVEAPVIAEITRKRHWLHTVSGAVQFSQAYISPNWYQGGDNNITLLIDLLWNVKLNQVYHPQWMLESNVHYKLGLYSTPSDEVHKYSISEDLFQWNFATGLKAAKHWYYSFNLQLKTQFLHNYEANSWTRKASFLSPGELNLGVGMTYSRDNKKKGLTFKAALAPLSYNLKTCFDSHISPTLFGIKEGRKSISEIGSSADLVLSWQLTSNILWTSRLFMFSDYTNFTGDIENTLNFAINRFLSTQIYVHGRYDTSAPGKSKGWKKWMMKEILSFGFSYVFSTVPKN